MQTISEPTALTVVPMRSQVIFPNTTGVFDVGRKLSIAAVEQTEQNGHCVFLTRQYRSEDESPTRSDICAVGTVARIRQTTRLPGNQLRVYYTGLYRARILSFYMQNDALVAVLERTQSIRDERKTEEAYLRIAQENAEKLIENGAKGRKELEAAIEGVHDPELFVDLCAHYANLKDDAKQTLLEEPAVTKRLALLSGYLQEENEVLSLAKLIGEEVRKNIDKAQREYYLREQLKVIHEQLGDDMEEADVLREKILSKKLPSAVEEKALHDLKRMDKMPASSPEYAVLRNYLDWIVELPWNEETQDVQSLADVEKTLDGDHYGLEKIKERVVEYLAVHKLTNALKSPILCLVGPPGVGKTSIATSIARALGRTFVRMSLGGVKDEAEIRGHRRTYIGAMPGRIIYEMKNAKTVNPVFLLDEVDKISSDMRGDPASALLEVLDPEQNATFRDRYLEVPYDLSKVLFIATANTLDTIPAPLRDRMEIIELSGYTPQEKQEIAKRYLVPKKRKECGLSAADLTVSDGAIAAMITGYTMEAGVRGLERTVGTVCRKAAVRIAKDENKKLNVTKKNLEEFLGAKRFHGDDEMLQRDEIGAATGLAWTAVGGTTLTIEVSAMQGKGEILLTGKLGDVMQESARAAISYLRSNADKYGLDEEIFEKTDIHVHVPEGATPKDGPSAGITMATAILSALTRNPVRRDVAMTGEITLHGKVLPIGGLKEKALAASRIGIHDIIIPEDNRKDMEEIPEAVRSGLNFICVNNVEQVFETAVTGIGYGH